MPLAYHKAKDVETMSKEKTKSKVIHRIMTALGIVLCAVFGFMLICNLTIIIKGTIHPELPPSVLGTTPLVVKSGSMSGTAPGHIEVGDLIFVSPVKPEELKAGDVIAFQEKGSLSVTTHRIVEVVKQENGAFVFSTKGDANNTVDSDPVSEDRLVGIYTGRIPKVGDFAMFMQTPLGMIVFIGIPLLAFIIYDIIRRQKYANKESRKTAELEAELERLRAMQPPQKASDSEQSEAEKPAK